jgi:hypothetical protein
MMYENIDKKHPQGSILLITLAALALLALMGFALMSGARNELTISGDTNLGRIAFTRADATARLAVLLTRPLFQLMGEGPGSYLLNTTNPEARPPFTVALDTAMNAATNLPEVGVNNNFTLADVRTRYLTATAAGLTPHLTISYDNEVAGTAFISYYAPVPDEGGLECDYGSGCGGGGANTRRVYLIISADGRLPLGDGADPGNYYTGTQDTKHTIVTTVYRAMLQ